MSTSKSADIKDLLSFAHQNTGLSKAGMQVISVPDLGQQMQNALGASAENCTTREAILFTILVDDSPSIWTSGNEQIVRDGVNAIIEALEGARPKVRESMLVSIGFLNAPLLCPYVPLSMVPKLDGNNFRASGWTPLYDRKAATLGGVVAKAAEFNRLGTRVHSVTVTITDGADEGSRHHREPESIAPLVKDMLQQELHVIYAMGISDGHTDFRNVFSRMGLRDNCVLTPGRTRQELRAAFGALSQSSLRASQAAGTKGFSASGIAPPPAGPGGGFGNNP